MTDKKKKSTWYCWACDMSIDSLSEHNQLHPMPKLPRPEEDSQDDD